MLYIILKGGINMTPKEIKNLPLSDNPETFPKEAKDIFGKNGKLFKCTAEVDKAFGDALNNCSAVLANLETKMKELKNERDAYRKSNEDDEPTREKKIEAYNKERDIIEHLQGKEKRCAESIKGMGEFLIDPAIDLNEKLLDKYRKIKYNVKFSDNSIAVKIDSKNDPNYKKMKGYLSGLSEGMRNIEERLKSTRIISLENGSKIPLEDALKNKKAINDSLGKLKEIINGLKKKESYTIDILAKAMPPKPIIDEGYAERLDEFMENVDNLTREQEKEAEKLEYLLNEFKPEYKSDIIHTYTELLRWATKVMLPREKRKKEIRYNKQQIDYFKEKCKKILEAEESFSEVEDSLETIEGHIEDLAQDKSAMEKYDEKWGENKMDIYKNLQERMLEYKAFIERIRSFSGFKEKGQTETQ